MIVRPALPGDVDHIVRNMRPMDRREIYAARFTDNDADLVADLLASEPWAICFQTLADNQGAPVALIGIWLGHPGTGFINMLATDAWPSIARHAHRYIARTILRDVAAKALHRLECKPMASNFRTRDWLKRLGFVEEGTASRYGYAGSTDFVHCAWLKPQETTHVRRAL